VACKPLSKVALATSGEASRHPWYVFGVAPATSGLAPRHLRTLGWTRATLGLHLEWLASHPRAFLECRAANPYAAWGRLHLGWLTGHPRISSGWSRNHHIGPAVTPLLFPSIFLPFLKNIYLYIF
jgi:hypothetical protein